MEGIQPPPWGSREEKDKDARARWTRLEAPGGRPERGRGRGGGREPQGGGGRISVRPRGGFLAAAVPVAERAEARWEGARQRGSTGRWRRGVGGVVGVGSQRPPPAREPETGRPGLGVLGGRLRNGESRESWLEGGGCSCPPEPDPLCLRTTVVSSTRWGGTSGLGLWPPLWRALHLPGYQCSPL